MRNLPAYPMAILKRDERGSEFVDYENGLTKREYFAGQAMVALLNANHEMSFNACARLACEQAEALCAELERTA